MLLLKGVEFSGGLLIERTPENGGNLQLDTYDELERVFKSEQLHPMDLKAMLTRQINALFDPVRARLGDESTKKLVQNSFPTKKSGPKKK